MIRPSKSFLIALTCAFCLVQAAAGQISVRSSLSDDRIARPGSSYEGTILIRNESDVVRQAKVYQTDYLFYADGSNLFGEPGSASRSNASWVDVSANQVILPPRQSVELPYRVHVPDSTTMSGSYWSMIMVEGISEQSAESILNPDSEEPEFGIRQVTRYGIQVATHIAQTGESALAIEKTDLLKTDSGDTVMHMNILNDGDLMVRPDVWVEVYNPAGEAVGRFEGSPNRLYPGTSIRQQIALGALPPGSYRALVIMDAGDDAVFGAEYDLAVN